VWTESEAARERQIVSNSRVIAALTGLGNPRSAAQLRHHGHSTVVGSPGLKGYLIVLIERVGKKIYEFPPLLHDLVAFHTNVGYQA
jgi:hypothetical protein